MLFSRLSDGAILHRVRCGPVLTAPTSPNFQNRLARSTFDDTPDAILHPEPITQRLRDIGESHTEALFNTCRRRRAKVLEEFFHLRCVGATGGGATTATLLFLQFIEPRTRYGGVEAVDRQT